MLCFGRIRLFKLAQAIVPGGRAMIPFSEMQIVEVKPLTIYRPARTHHKKRLRKKYLKRYGWKVVGDVNFLGDQLLMDERSGIVYGHPHVIRRLRQHLEATKREKQERGENFLFGKDWGF